jgi:hypothetical protein
MNGKINSASGARRRAELRWSEQKRLWSADDEVGGLQSAIRSEWSERRRKMGCCG